MIFPRKQVAFAQTGGAQYILKGFTPNMGSGSHACISNVARVSWSSVFNERDVDIDLE